MYESVFEWREASPRESLVFAALGFPLRRMPGNFPAAGFGAGAGEDQGSLLGAGAGEDQGSLLGAGAGEDDFEGGFLSFAEPFAEESGAAASATAGGTP